MKREIFALYAAKKRKKNQKQNKKQAKKKKKKKLKAHKLQSELLLFERN